MSGAPVASTSSLQDGGASETSTLENNARSAANACAAAIATEGKGGHLAKDGDGNEYMRPHCGERMSTRLIQLIIKKGLRAIGLDSHEYSAHSLRHTTGCQMIKSGASLMDVQRVLRHSSPTTTMIYLKSIEQEERLSKAPESVLDNAFKSHADKQ